jgi:hypothetical protein
MTMLINIVSCLPLFAFMMYGRWYGVDNDLAWKNAFILGSLLSLVVVSIQLCYKVVFNRLLLGGYLFLITGAILFMTEAYSILYYYGVYKGASFLSSIALVGIITTFFTKAGFVGVESHDTLNVKKLSLQLLALNFIAVAWAVGLYSYGLIVTAVVPSVVLSRVREELRNKLTQ